MNRALRPVTISLLALSLAAPALAAPLRSPQVPVSGSGLADFFASQGQSIAVVGDQVLITEIALSNVGIPGGSYTLLVRPMKGGGTLDLYNAAAASPPLYTIFPGAASNGWYTVTSMHTGPDRLVVSLFDDQDIFVGTTTFLGADGFRLGIAVEGLFGARYAEDFRNPNGYPSVLFYAGTGAHHGDIWVCNEDAASGPGGDFADHVFLISGIGVVSVQHASWGTLKQRFR